MNNKSKLSGFFVIILALIGWAVLTYIIVPGYSKTFYYLENNKIVSANITNGKKEIIGDWEKPQIENLENYSPDGKYFITHEDNLEVLVNKESGEKYIIRPDKKFSQTKNAKWSPDGAYIAFTKTPSADIETWGDNILHVASIEEIITGEYKNPHLSTAQITDFDWLNKDEVLYWRVSDNYNCVPGAELSKYNLFAESGSQYERLSKEIMIPGGIYNGRLSDDKKYFAYQKAVFKDNVWQEDYVAVFDLDGREVIFEDSGSNPSWDKNITEKTTTKPEKPVCLLNQSFSNKNISFKYPEGWQVKDMSYDNIVSYHIGNPNNPQYLENSIMPFYSISYHKDKFGGSWQAYLPESMQQIRDSRVDKTVDNQKLLYFYGVTPPVVHEFYLAFTNNLVYQFYNYSNGLNLSEPEKQDYNYLFNKIVESVSFE